MALMLRADLGVFNLTLTGHAPETGRVFRLGMVIALEKPVYAYISRDLDPLEYSLGLDDILENSAIKSYLNA